MSDSRSIGDWCFPVLLQMFHSNINNIHCNWMIIWDHHCNTLQLNIDLEAAVLPGRQIAFHRGNTGRHNGKLYAWLTINMRWCFLGFLLSLETVGSTACHIYTRDTPSPFALLLKWKIMNIKCNYNDWITIHFSQSSEEIIHNNVVRKLYDFKKHSHSNGTVGSTTTPWEFS